MVCFLVFILDDQVQMFFRVSWCDVIHQYLLHNSFFLFEGTDVQDSVEYVNGFFLPRNSFSFLVPAVHNSLCLFVCLFLLKPLFSNTCV